MELTASTVAPPTSPAGSASAARTVPRSTRATHSALSTRSVDVGDAGQRRPRRGPTPRPRRGSRPRARPAPPAERTAREAETNRRRPGRTARCCRPAPRAGGPGRWPRRRRSRAARRPHGRAHDHEGPGRTRCRRRAKNPSHRAKESAALSRDSTIAPPKPTSRSGRRLIRAVAGTSSTSSRTSGTPGTACSSSEVIPSPSVRGGRLRAVIGSRRTGPEPEGATGSEETDPARRPLRDSLASVARVGRPTSTTLLRGRLVLADDVLDDGVVELVGDRVTDVRPARAGDPDPVGTLLPGLVDVHCHGGGGHALAGSGAEEARAATAFHRAHGTTTLVASVVTDEVDRMLAQVRVLAALAADGEVAGIHLEGPFLAPARRGAHAADRLLAPDPEVLARLLDAGAGHVRHVTLAPELTGADRLADDVRAAGAVVAVGHTDADHATAAAAFAAGARSATHLFNAMRPWHHRDSSAVRRRARRRRARYRRRRARRRRDPRRRRHGGGGARPRPRPGRARQRRRPVGRAARRPARPRGRRRPRRRRGRADRRRRPRGRRRHAARRAPVHRPRGRRAAGRGRRRRHPRARRPARPGPPAGRRPPRARRPRRTSSSSTTTSAPSTSGTRRPSRRVRGPRRHPRRNSDVHCNRTGA